MPDDLWNQYIPSAAPLSKAEGSGISTAEEIIAEARAGRMFVLVDDENRENEGDLIIPAQFASPEIINFMAKHCRGLICLALTQRRVVDLALPMMASRNHSSFGTNFTVSIEAREGVTTGISAYDRARTIATAINPESTPFDLVRPGHIFPLAAKPHGVLERPGHTEASVDIARLAGLIPAAVICEIIGDDGTMARGAELIQFCEAHRVKLGTIADLVAYREQSESLLCETAQSELVHEIGGRWALHVIAEIVTGQEHLVLTKGAVGSCSMASVYHHRCNPLGGLVPGYGVEVVAHSMRAISDAGRGVLILSRSSQQGGLSKHFSGEPGCAGLSHAALERQILNLLGFRAF